MPAFLDGKPGPRPVAAFFIALTVCGVLALAGPASGNGRLHPPVVALELAPDAAAARSVMARWDRSAAIEAVHWDYAFILAYGGFFLLAGLRLARGTRGLWRFLAVCAAVSGTAAALFDLRENGALLDMLHGEPSDGMARISHTSATVKFVLLVPSVVCLGAALLALAFAGARREEISAEMPQAQVVPSTGELRPCDLVMKGGITSGIVYPRAVCELARHYCFRNIGGASAGAIAAAFTAAAEHARQGGAAAAFANLESVTRWLEEPGRLLQLFRPDRAMKPVFRVFVAALRGKSPSVKGARAVGAAILAYPGWLVAGLLPGAVLGSWAFFAGAPTAGAAVFAVVSLGAIPALLAGGALFSLLAVSPRNGFGICSGHAPALAGEVASLTDWLTEMLERLAAGIAPTAAPPEPSRPLTFGDLRARNVNLEMLTNSLTHGRPYGIPFETRELFFRLEEFEQLFPPLVTRYLGEITRNAVSADGLRPLPAGDALPVVVGVRMSLSFPLLLTAVPLYAVDYSSPSQRAELCWFSDGGIASNFPIHFFDRLLPEWPTFGIDLTPVHRSWVYLPQRVADGRAEAWNRFSTLPGFFGALLNSIHSWMDNRQSRVAGFRDRIVRISLAPGEGGLNVDMSADQIKQLAQRGVVAGRLLAERFVSPGGEGWPNHLWTRYRLLMRKLEEELPAAARVLRDAQLVQLESSPPVYKFGGRGAALSKAMRELLLALADEWARRRNELEASLADGAPRSPVDLRVAPRV